MSEITFLNQTKTDMTRWEDLYADLFKVSIKVLGLKDHLSLAVNWIDKATALNLNKTYREQEYVPDVLSFPLEMNATLGEEIGEQELGDLFICYDVALKKAEKYQHDAYKEMAFLFVHGLLHLLGYDHEESSAAEKLMFSLQDKILKAYNIIYEVVYDDESYL